ncbi:hypothetical protein FLLO111716_03405 [Flavobacterium longum]|uniref:hypothetical protein n=1 Tax=Flavobacterium longum TaxID=1299340 RepID=UPI0039EB44E8
MTKGDKIFLDVFALTATAAMFLLFLGFAFLLIVLSIPTAILGALLLFIVCWKINDVVYIDSHFHIISRFFVPKKIPVSDLVEIKAKRFFTSRVIQVFYMANGKLNHSALTFIGLFGNDRLIALLNALDHEKVHHESFDAHFEIRYRDGEFKCH